MFNKGRHPTPRQYLTACSGQPHTPKKSRKMLLPASRPLLALLLPVSAGPCDNSLDLCLLRSFLLVARQMVLCCWPFSSPALLSGCSLALLCCFYHGGHLFFLNFRCSMLAPHQASVATLRSGNISLYGNNYHVKLWPNCLVYTPHTTAYHCNPLALSGMARPTAYNCYFVLHSSCTHMQRRRC